MQNNDNHNKLLKTVNKILISSLKQTYDWLAWCIIFAIIALGLCIAYLVTLDTDPIKKGYLAINYIFLIGSVIWISLTIRDRRNEQMINGFAKDTPDISNLSNKWSSSLLRMIISWIFFAISIVIFVVGMVTFNLDISSIINGILVEVGIIAAIFQLVKIIQDRMFANVWQQFSVKHDV